MKCSLETISYAWVSPTGEVHRINTGTHGDWALHKVLSPSDVRRLEENPDAHAELEEQKEKAFLRLLKDGWIRVSNAYNIDAEPAARKRAWEGALRLTVDCVLSSRSDPFSTLVWISIGWRGPQPITVDEAIHEYARDLEPVLYGKQDKTMRMASRVARRFLQASGLQIDWRGVDGSRGRFDLDVKVQRVVERLARFVGEGLNEVGPTKVTIFDLAPERQPFKSLRLDFRVGSYWSGTLPLNISFDGRTVMGGAHLPWAHSPEFDLFRGKKITPKQILARIVPIVQGKKAEHASGLEALQAEEVARKSKLKDLFQEVASDFVRDLGLSFQGLGDLHAEVGAVEANHQGFSIVSTFKTDMGKPFNVAFKATSENGPHGKYRVDITSPTGDSHRDGIYLNDSRSVGAAVRSIIQRAREEASRETSLVDRVSSLISDTRTDNGGRNSNVKLVPGTSPHWEVRPERPKSLDHYGPDGWDEDAWVEEYVEPIEATVTAELEAAFGRGTFRVEVHENGDFSVSPTPVGAQLL